jgi:RND family efflux transporter MFP subunit
MPVPKSALPTWVSALLFCAVAVAGHAAPALTISQTDVAEEKIIAGTITGTENPLARTRIGGTLTRLMVERGAAVKKGQLMAVVEDSSLPGQTSASNRRLEAAQARTRLAHLNLQRMQSLLPLDSASPAQVEQAQAQYQAALAEEAGAQTTADGRILAPIDGLVAELNAVSGSVVMPGESIARVAASPLLVSLQMPERHASLLQPGAQVPLTGTAASASPTTLTGTVSRIYPSVSNGYLTVEVQAQGLESFKVGEKILARLQTGSHKGVLVPATTLIPRNGLVFVRLHNSTEVVVQPGRPRADGTVEILSGLNEGDIVVQP